MLEMQGILFCSRSLASSDIQSRVTKNNLKTALVSLASSIRMCNMTKIKGFFYV